MHAPESDFIPIGPLTSFLSSHRYVLSFRSWSNPANHTQILIYRSNNNTDEEEPTRSSKWYSIANECPHLGLPLEQGDIEDFTLSEPLSDEEEQEEGEEEEGLNPNQPIIICPFHQYDYGLIDGKSSNSTGSTACTYKVEVREDGKLWVETPGGRDEDFRILGVRAVSEQFADSAPRPGSIDLSSLLSTISLSSSDTSPSLTLPKSPSSPSTPSSIAGWCRLILLAPSPSTKVLLIRHLVTLFRSGQLTRLSSPSTDPPQPSAPFRDPQFGQTVLPGKIQSRGKGGSVASRIKLLHSLAAIEQWACDLAVDCISRFHDWKLGTHDGKKGKRMEWSFVADFLKVAEDEAKHFTLLEERLGELGTRFGDLKVHGALWESAEETKDSLFSRLAIVHLVHEARGLDSNPIQIKRCRQAGDERTAQVLEIIHYDEITHVAAGHRHFLSLCTSHTPPLDPIITFRTEVEQHFYGALKGPFNAPDREKAGMERGWYEGLRGRGRGIGPKDGDGDGETAAEGRQ